MYDSITNVCHSCEASGGWALSPLLCLSAHKMISYYVPVPCASSASLLLSPALYLYILNLSP